MKPLDSCSDIMSLYNLKICGVCASCLATCSSVTYIVIGRWRGVVQGILSCMNHPVDK